MNTIKYNILNCRRMAVLWLVPLLLFAGCKKDSMDNTPDDNNSIGQVIADNFNLSILKAVFAYSKLDKKLKEKGPVTVLAPSDAAFNLAGYTTPTAVLLADASVISGIGKYHILDGKYEFNKLPFQFNQELRSQNGKLYATRWVKNSDTVLTINGSRIVAVNVPASNGLIQVISRVLTPYTHDKLGDAIASETSVTLFYQALKTSGLLKTINGSDVFTVFSPSNDAMKAYGLETLEQVRETNPEILKRLVNYHIVRDRRFIYDYILSTNSSAPIKQATLDGGSTINISLVQDNSEPGGFSGITLQGQANNNAVNVQQRDILTGNGVLHVIDGVLKSAL